MWLNSLARLIIEKNAISLQKEIKEFNTFLYNMSLLFENVV